MDPQLGAPNHPTVDVRVLTVHGIVVGNVLQIAGNGIETKPALGCDITESDPTRGVISPTRWRQVDGIANRDHRHDASDRCNGSR